MSFKHIGVPKTGSKIQVIDGKLSVPDDPIIPFIEGDGIGGDITKAMHKVVDNAVKVAYGGKRKISWMEIYAGDKAMALYNEPLPEESIDAIREYIVAIKGPLTTPVGEGIRSLNVSIRQILDLYACVRPVKYYEGTPSPLKNPELLNVVIFRENTEDLYAGVEWEMGSLSAKKLIEYIKKEFSKELREDSGIGIKPISVFATQRLMRKALEHAISTKKKTVTVVHKGNIMKYTEGAFKNWCYDVAVKEFRDYIVTEEEIKDKYNGKAPDGKIVVNNRIADSMFQQLLLRPNEYEVLVTPNLNGDYLSDAAAAEVGGLGMAPGSNIGDFLAVFEATHGTAPKYTNLDKTNPGSLILSASLMLTYMGWMEASEAIERGMQKTVRSKKVTYDLARQIEGATEVKCSEFAQEICNNM